MNLIRWKHVGYVRRKPGSGQRRGNRAPKFVWWSLPLTLTAFVGLWALVVSARGYAPFILPGPDRVAARFAEMMRDGSLCHHSAVTLYEILTGLIVGLTAAPTGSTDNR